MKKEVGVIEEFKIKPIKSWAKSEKAENKRQEEKERVREAYKNKREVEIIPATIAIDGDDRKVLRVAAYCRVSTLEDAQAGSFERQIQHFKDVIEARDGWVNVGIYADEGASGTNRKHRPKFNEMIQDCKDGKIDLIVTKSVSRFARNTSDCLQVVRELKNLNPPVGVYFEDINLNTAEAKNEFTLGVMSLVAQGESEQKSAAITWSIIERFRRGVPIITTTNLLGYDKDRYGKLVIVEEEAYVIRYIYASFIAGHTTSEIAEKLTEGQVPTVRGNKVWQSGAVRNILKNEKYCGDVIMQKTFTVDCFSHRKLINKGQKPKYRLTGHHEPIIPKEQWLKVQELLTQPRRKISVKDIALEKKFTVTKIKNGKLKGFIIVDPDWRSTDIDKLFEKYAK